MRSASILAIIAFIFCSEIVVAQQFQWAKGFDINTLDWGEDLKTDAAGNIYMAGTYRGTADLDPGPNTASVTSIGWNDMYIIKLDASGNHVWSVSLGGTGYNDRINEIAVDDLGNVYAVGEFEATVDFDPGAGVVSRTSSGGTDAFVMKLGASGNLLWAHAYGASADDKALSVRLDAAGRPVIGGAFGGIVDFDPGSNVDMHFSLIHDLMVFVQKLDANGNHIWTKDMGGVQVVYGVHLSVGIDMGGNVIATGVYQGTADFDPGPNTYNLIAASFSESAFIVKLDSLGNLVWAESFGGIFPVGPNSIHTDQQGDIYVTGGFSGPADFDPDTATFILSGGILGSGFVAKYSSDGSLKWANAIVGQFYTTILDSDIDDDRNIYVVGRFDGAINFTPPNPNTMISFNGTRSYIAVYDSAGVFQRYKFGSQLGDAAVIEISISPNNEVFYSGSFAATLDFDTTLVGATLSPSGNTGIFVAKFAWPVTSVSTPYFSESVKLYPNPSSGQIVVESQGPSVIEVFNTTGQLVYRSEETVNISNHSLSGLATGLYLVRIQTAGKYAHEKLIVR